MTTDTAFERATKNPELMNLAGRRCYIAPVDTGESRLPLIAAATMLVLEKGWYVKMGVEGGAFENLYLVLRNLIEQPGDEKAVSYGPDLLTALLDALEAEDE